MARTVESDKVEPGSKGSTTYMSDLLQVADQTIQALLLDEIL